MSYLHVINQPKFIEFRRFRVENHDNIRGHEVNFAHFTWQGIDYYCRVRTVWKNTHIIAPALVKHADNKKQFKTRINIPYPYWNCEFFFYPPQGITTTKEFCFAGFHSDSHTDLEFLLYENDRLTRIPQAAVEDEKLGKFKITQPRAGLVI